MVMTSRLNLTNYDKSNVVYLVSLFLGVVISLRGRKS